MARDLLVLWRGREIDKSDGFLLLFADVADAVGYALAYHAALAKLDPPLQARAAVHLGLLTLRENPPHDVARGAKPIELDGAAKPAAARIMALAQPGQTLLSAAARSGWPDGDGSNLRSHGHWRFKGLIEAIELFEVGDDASRLAPPADGPKGWRVVRQGESWVPAGAVPHSLPAERDRFVGREADLRELSERIDHGARLLSVLGIGGSGKTRLALHFGWTWLGDFAGGVWFCDLSAARSEDDIVHSLAQGLLQQLVGADPAGQVGDVLAARGACLVIVDNFEQVTRHAESTLGRWLERAPEATFIVTTREVLGIVGESALALPPLPASDGATLLRERAASAGAVRFTSADEAAVPRLVLLLECLPLAIELAASRMRVLPPAQLLPRLGERFKVLRSNRGRHDRQATLQATLDWSWDLLGDAERATLAQLSVFEGGFTVQAVEAVVDLPSRDPPIWPIDVLHSLVDKSLVRKVSDVRFDLLRSVQEYAAQKLSAPATPTSVRAATEAAHANFFHGLLATLRRAVENGDHEALRQIGAEFENCRAAWQWALAQEQTDALMTSARTLVHFWDHLGRNEEGLAMLRDAIDSRSAGADPRLGPLLSIAAHLEYRLDRYADAMATATRALAASRKTRDRETRRQCFNVLGACSLGLRRLADARRYFKRALRLSPASDDPTNAAAMLDNLALVEKEMGRHAESLQMAMQSLAQHRLFGDFAGEALCLNNIGALQMDLGEIESAALHLNAGFALCDVHDLISTRGLILANLTDLALQTGDPSVAEAHARQGLEVAQLTGNRLLESWLKLRCLLIALRRGDLVAARAELRAALQIAAAIARPGLLLAGVSCFADLLEAQGELDCACSVLRFACAHPSTSDEERDDIRERLAQWQLAKPAELSWPGLDLGELVQRIVAETEVAHSPLTALLRGET
ncbi:MAG TPA: hypothetical protein VGH48_17450 [Caldimonas sp.]